MSEYNIDICKRNIKTIMNNRNPKITQNELAKCTGIPQPQISKNLAEDKSNFFTIQQLVSISNYLQVSVDDLLNESRQSEKGKHSSISIGSLSDLAEILFIINKHIPIKFETVTISDNIKNGPDKPFGDNPRLRTAICFDNPSIERFISEWKRIVESTRDIECRDKLLTLWEKDSLTRLKEYLAENDYMELDEYSQNVCSKHLRHIDDDEYKPSLTIHEIDAIEHYLLRFARELESYEYDFLNRIYKTAKEDMLWLNIPDGIDDILPF